MPVFILISCAKGQRVNEGDVPATVRTSFSSMFPDIKKAKWEREKEKYEAVFDKDKKEISVLFEPTGVYLQTETEIEIATLPPAIKDYVTKNLAGKKISEAIRITNAKNETSYEIEIGDENYLFDVNGNFLRKESSDEEDEDDNDD